jgi:predicted dehydrogenase
MAHTASRRQFLQTTAVTGIGFWVAGGVQAQESKSPNERVAMASIGVSGKGSSDSQDAGKHGDMVAICDVDEAKLGAAAKKFPSAKQYVDFRKMLEEMGKSIDAVTVSTPDHMHAPAGLMAMRMGKHCFCQKPMTHTIYEARLMAKVAKEMKVATQMGNQGTATKNLRTAAAVIKAGAVGKVKEVHVWTNRPIWPQGGDRPEPCDPPADLHWDLWLGVAPKRQYGKGAYHPFSWRGWWDFGTGALGDMACHTVNMPYMALALHDPISIQAETSGHNKDSYPERSVITFEYPANDWRPALKMVWYDGGNLPPEQVVSLAELQNTEKFKKLDKKGFKSGCVIIGDKGKMCAPGDYAEKGYVMLNGATEPEVQVVESPGHFDEWVRAIKGGEPAWSNFPNYSGGLTETILLGNLAVWVAASGKGEKVEWDAANLKAKNVAGLEHIIKPVYAPGYTLDV